MGRRLPEYDPDTGPYQKSKRRREIFKRIYRQMQRWKALQEDVGMSHFITTPDGEDVYYGDLMVGFDTLPRQQRRAFDLICLQEYTESDATREILPNSRWSTPVQQYSEDGLKKMVAAYDAVQAGVWDPAGVVKKCRSKRKEPAVKTDQDKTEAPGPKFSRVDYLDWTVCSAENQRLADYINTKTGLGITGRQVKAVAFLRKPWYRSPEEATNREEEARAREAEKAKFAYETPEQREKRFEAARRLRAARVAETKARALQEEVRELRAEAGLDPETGEPLVVI